MSSNTSADEKTKLISAERRVETKINVTYDRLVSNPSVLSLTHFNGNSVKIDGKSISGKQFTPKTHCHSLGHRGDGIDRGARRKLIVASTLCFTFMLIEIIGGFLANSLAIATDAAHLLTDLAGFIISLLSLYISARPANSRMSFGWHRAEVIGALISVLLIWVVTGILCYIAVQRIITQNYEIDANIMVITATIGVVVNILMGIQLQVNCEDSVTDDENKNTEPKAKNINIRAAMIHVLGDFVQSLGVLVAALIIYFEPEYAIADPICTFLFSIVVIVYTFNIIKDVLNVLVEGKPTDVDFFEIQDTLYNIQGVIKVHNLRIWSLSLDKTALSVHLAIAKTQNPTNILNIASQEIKNNYNIYDLTIQVEEYTDEMIDCQQCQTPES